MPVFVHAERVRSLRICFVHSPLVNQCLGNRRRVTRSLHLEKDIVVLRVSSLDRTTDRVNWRNLVAMTEVSLWSWNYWRAPDHERRWSACTAPMTIPRVIESFLKGVDRRVEQRTLNNFSLAHWTPDWSSRLNFHRCCCPGKWMLSTSNWLKNRNDPRCGNDRHRHTRSVSRLAVVHRSVWSMIHRDLLRQFLVRWA